MGWHDCVDANERALAISGDTERGYGLEIEGKGGAVSCNCGRAPVRIPHAAREPLPVGRRRVA